MTLATLKKLAIMENQSMMALFTIVEASLVSKKTCEYFLKELKSLRSCGLD